MYVTGVLLGTSRKSGTFEGKPYDFTLLHILDGIAVQKVRLPDGVHNSPWGQGEEVTVSVAVAENAKVTADASAVAEAFNGRGK